MTDTRTIKTALITGITGSGGSYMAEHILEHHPDVAVHGTTRWHSTSAGGNIEGFRSKVTLHECDLTDFSAIFSILRAVKPDAIFHLASHANVKASFATPLSVLHNNISGTANMLEAARLVEIDPLIQLCSTSEVYGQVKPEEVPITEEQPMRPSSPYAVSKITQDLLGWTYFMAYRMRIVRTRMFAYLNPRRPDLFATSFARQVARIEAGRQKELLHGNLDSVRTMIDVRDAMESYWIATMKGEFGEAYNIGGTTTIKVGDLLEKLKELSDVPIPCRQDPNLLRPADVTLQIPCTRKFEKATGWKPRYSFKESLDNLLQYWRERVRQGRDD